MYSSENEHLIFWTKAVLILAGFWNQPLTDNFILQKIFLVYSGFMRTLYFVFWFFIVCELVRLICYKYDISTIISSLSVVVNASKITVKLIIYMRYRVLNLFNEVIQKEQEVWESENKEIHSLYRKKIRIGKIYVMALAGSTLITVIGLIATGAVNTMKVVKHNKMYNTSMEAPYMYQSLIPPNKQEHLYWLFGSELLWSWAGITYNSATHTIFSTLLLYAASQLEILQYNLRRFVKSGSNNLNEEEIMENIANLKCLIVDHQYIIRFIQDYNRYARYIILMEFVLSSLDMASVSVQIIKTNMSSLSESGWTMLFLILLLVQLYLIGWSCNEVKIQSEAIADALFESNWYLLNKEAGQLIQIMIARAQRPLIMTIGPFGPMTMGSVFMVIKAAYSYVSIMK